MTRAMPGAINYKTTNPVRQFITSGSANEIVPDQSIFRKEFINAITTNYANAYNQKEYTFHGTNDDEIENNGFYQDNSI
jgi:hypothetical protein